MQTIVSGLPANLAASVLVVIHTAAVEQGHLADVLNRNGNMRAVTALHGSLLRHRHIYVAKPDHHLTVSNDRTWLSRGPTVNRHRPAIDPLFRSAARAYGKRVIGVILTGFLDDGSAGLASIKANGGIGMVQEPDEAFGRDMPMNALWTAKPDYRLPIVEIAPMLVRLVTGRENGKRGME